jgi:hypothetical protein
VENKCQFLIEGKHTCDLVTRPAGNPQCQECLGNGKAPEINLFTPYTFDDICETPIRVTSKRQLKELCKVHNVRAARLM